MLEANVRETNLAAQLFFRVHGFKAIGVEREAYSDTGEAAYVMQFNMPADVPARA